MQAESFNQDDVGAGLGLITSVLTNMIQSALMNTLKESGILEQRNDSKDEEEDNQNSIGANSARRENHTNRIKAHIKAAQTKKLSYP